MKKLFLAFMICFAYAFSHAQSPVGIWKTIDDKSGKEKGYVKIYEAENGKLQGDVVKILTPGHENIQCTQCEGDRKNKPVMGMTIMWGLEKNGDEWTDGHIIDTNSGKQYKCYIKLKGNDRLEVRGYLGFALLGRTQVWERIE